MPVDMKFFELMSEAQELVKQGELGEASHVVETIYAYVERTWDAYNSFESMSMLGTLAILLRTLDQTDREIKVREHLCSVAEADLERKGIRATDEDVKMTGMDLVHLGIAYRKRQRLEDARVALEKGRYRLEELGWECDIEKIMSGQPTRIGPSEAVTKRPYQPKPGEQAKFFQETLKTMEDQNNRWKQDPHMQKVLKSIYAKGAKHSKKPWWKFW
jgi:hypothetical protein